MFDLALDEIEQGWRFTNCIQKNVSTMEMLNKYYQTSQVLELKDFPFLEGFIKEIFIN